MSRLTAVPFLLNIAMGQLNVRLLHFLSLPKHSAGLMRACSGHFHSLLLLLLLLEPSASSSSDPPGRDAPYAYVMSSYPWTHGERPLQYSWEISLFLLLSHSRYTRSMNAKGRDLSLVGFGRPQLGKKGICTIKGLRDEQRRKKGCFCASLKFETADVQTN